MKKNHSIPTHHRWVLKGMAHCPLLFLHMLGGALGFLAFISQTQSRRKALAFANKANLPHPLLSVCRSYIDFGRTVLEAPWIWLNSPEKTLKKFHIQMDPRLESLIRRRGSGNIPVLFVSAHLGCSEAAIVFLSEHFQSHTLYQRQKKPFMLAMRQLHHPKHQATFFSMNTSGIRQLVRYLSRGGCVTIAIDQTPPEGSGEWLAFFDHPAYTMMLAPKISCMDSVATVSLLHVRRWGGFSISLRLMENLPNSPVARAAAFNRMIEEIVLQYPHQYRWSYNRYRHRPRNKTGS